MNLTVFDLDHTLLDGDSDVLWCDFLVQQGRLDHDEFMPRNRAMETGYRSGTVSTQDFCAFYVGLLAGLSVQDWQPLCQQFLHHWVAPRIPAPAQALVQRHQAQGDVVVLSTATNRVITQLTAQHLGIAHLIATECEQTPDGRLTGKVSGTANMRDGKIVRLQAWLAQRGTTLEACKSRLYSDSMNDLPLLSVVNHAVVVNADPRLADIAQQRGWPALNLRV